MVKLPFFGTVFQSINIFFLANVSLAQIKMLKIKKPILIMAISIVTHGLQRGTSTEIFKDVCLPLTNVFLVLQ